MYSTSVCWVHEGILLRARKVWGRNSFQKVPKARGRQCPLYTLVPSICSLGVLSGTACMSVQESGSMQYTCDHAH